MAGFAKSGPYSEKTVKERRKMPIKNIVGMIFLVAFQVIAILLAAFYDPEPEPLDHIEEYNVTVTPNYDGTLNIKYDILWRALDESEPLEWVEIGLANRYFSLLPGSVSHTVKEATPIHDEDYPYMQLDFRDTYSGGETVRFSFEINQREMLCKDGDRRFIEFVPGWFNEISIEKYHFAWYDNGEITNLTEGAERVGDYYVWEGSLDRGGYKQIRVEYNQFAFDPYAATVEYIPFDDSGAYDGLDTADDVVAVWILVVFIIIVLFVIELYLVDSFVSYGRGRGFMMGYGHPIHVYGYGNPRYKRAAEKDAEQRGRTAHARGG